MAKLCIDADLARALSTIGGRPLFKSMEVLAGNIASSSGGKMISDGSVIKLTLPAGSVRITVEDADVHMSGKYYAFQDGSVIFSGKHAVLKNLLQVLLGFASKRQEYLAGKDLSRYDLNPEFIEALPTAIHSLKIKT